MPKSGIDKEELLQRSTRKSRAFLYFPISLAFLMGVDLIWETIRANLSSEATRSLPFSVTFLDVEASATVFGVLLALIIARQQFARSVRPALGWSGDLKVKWYFLARKELWVVKYHNGGSGPCVVAAVAFRVVPRQAASVVVESSGFGEWVSHAILQDQMQRLGLVRDRDFHVRLVAEGKTMPSQTVERNGEVVAYFSPKALDVLLAVDMRLDVVDIAGDSHQRVLRFLYGAPGVPLPSAVTR